MGRIVLSVTIIMFMPGTAVPPQTPQKQADTRAPEGWEKVVSKEGGFQVFLMGPAKKFDANSTKVLPSYTAFDVAKGQATPWVTTTSRCRRRWAASG